MQPYQWIRSDAFTALPALAPESVDALITDPPYSSGGLHAGDRAKDPVSKYEQSTNLCSRASFSGDSKDQRSWIRWSSEWLRLCYRALKEGSPIAVFSDWRQLPALTDAIQMADFVWRGIAVWDKTEGARPQPGRPRNQCEYVVWGSKGRLPLDRRAPILPGVHQEYPRQADKHHLTGKPVQLMSWLCKLAPPGGLILDPFGGSASTGVAALISGYQFFGIERDEHYHQVGAARLAAAAAGEVISARAPTRRRPELHERRSRDLTERRPRQAAVMPAQNAPTRRRSKAS